MSIDTTESQAIRSLLTDSFGRVAELVEGFRGLSADAATARPAPHANTIAWLLWHLSRVQDDHVCGLAGREQAWAHGWHERLSLPFPFGDIGFGHSTQDVGRVRTPVDELLAYHADVHALSLEYVASLTVEELDRVVDTRWDPPVTASMRLVSLLGDCLQHAGQAAYVRGIVE
ncbi:MAG: mycothiol transferase [Nocardioidaceae bacterium]